MVFQVIHSFQLSPDFRPRASSNASSCGGRLSPILGVNENHVDLHDNQVPPMSPWTLDYSPYSGQQTPYGSSLPNSGDRFGAEQLAGSLANTMKLTDGCFLPPPPNVQEYTGGFSLTVSSIFLLLSFISVCPSSSLFPGMYLFSCLSPTV
jgi:hypothetical protein